MRRFLLWALSIIPVLATPPTVSNIRFDNTLGQGANATVMHSAVEVIWDQSAAVATLACGSVGVPGEPSCYRVRVNTVDCAGGTGGTLYYVGGSANQQIAQSANIYGLAGGTGYYFCPELSDGVTWSSGISAQFTPPAIPAVHPALPIAPAVFPIPASPAIGGGSCGSGSGICAVLSDCSNYATMMAAAVFGDTVTLPPAAACQALIQLPPAPDAVAFLPSAVTTSTSTIVSVGHGLSNNQQVRLGNSNTPSPGLPACAYPAGNNCPDSAGLQIGYPYWVIVTDANDFQLALKSGGSAINFGAVPLTISTGASTVTLGTVMNVSSWGGDFGPGNPIQISCTGTSPGVGCTLPGGLSFNTNYYFLSNCVNAAAPCASQLSATNGGSPITLTTIGTGTIILSSQGSGTHYYLPWPPANPAYITVRNSGGDSVLTPDGVQVQPVDTAAIAAMPELQQASFNNFSPSGFLINGGVLTHNWRFTGIHWGVLPTAAAEIPTTSDPRSKGQFLHCDQSCGNIILDRNYSDGATYPDRLHVASGYGTIQFDGANMAIVNSYLTGLNFWHPWSTWNSAPSTYTSSAITYAAGNATLGQGKVCVTTSNTVITVTSFVSGIGIVYFDMSCGIHVVITSGGSATCSTSAGVTCSVTTEASPIFPVNANGRMDGLPIGQFTTTGSVVACAGNIGACFTPSQGSAGFDGESSVDNSEGTQFVIADHGPGPFNISQNYISGTGIMFHFADGGNTFLRRGDYTIYRNTGVTPAFAMNGGAVSNGLRYGNRQIWEWKAGSRQAFIGNTITGNFNEDTSLSPCYEEYTLGGEISDIHLRSNTCFNTAFGFNIDDSQTGPTVHKPVARVLVENNLLYGLNGYTYFAAGACCVSGAFGAQFVSRYGLEDIAFAHNTTITNSGTNSSIAWFTESPVEGFSLLNNLLEISNGTTGTLNENVNNCAGSLQNKLLLDCALLQGPGITKYAFHSVLVPVGGNTQASVQTNWPTTGFMTALVPTGWSAVGLTNTNLANLNPSLLFNSSYKSGAHIATDNTDEGVDWNLLLTDQGAVGPPSVLAITASSANVSWWAYDRSFACYVDYSTAPNDPSTHIGGGRVRATSGNAQSVTLPSLSAVTAYNYRLLCAVMQQSGSFLTR